MAGIAAFGSAKLWLIVLPETRMGWASLEDVAPRSISVNIPVLLLKSDESPLPDRVAEFSAVSTSPDMSLGLGVIRDIISVSLANRLVSFDLFGRPKQGSGIILASSAANKLLAKAVLEKPDLLRILDPSGLEEMIAEIFAGFGYSVELTAKTRDGGRDIVALRSGVLHERFLIECKTSPLRGVIGVEPVRSLYGVMKDERATKAILATTAVFTRDARIFFDRHRWELEGRDRDGIIGWLRMFVDDEKAPA